MKGLRAKELRGTEPAELQRQLAKLEEELFKNKLKKTTNQLENTMVIRNTRRDIARLHTVLAARLRETGSSVATSAAAAEATKEGTP
jgi:large subunit ribosomal protein L29